MNINIYERAIKTIPAEQIDHHDSDLYIMVTPESRKIVNEYEFKQNVTTFISAIAPHVLWFDIPFAYTPYWDNIRKYTPVPITPRNNRK